MYRRAFARGLHSQQAGRYKRHDTPARATSAGDEAHSTNFTAFMRHILAHLRIPFSFFLLPVFLFGVSGAAPVNALHTAVAFVVMHLFIYPASNGYNSYMDQDEGPIGGLEHPPPATRGLYITTIFVDLAGLALCLLADWRLALLALGYIGFSKAYSWSGIRLKKYAWLGWASVAFFQGGYTYALGSMAASAQYNVAQWFNQKEGIAMLFATLMIGASYPLTQVYQHGEDSARGDRTISVALGVRGTFLFSAVLFAVGGALAGYYFLKFYSWQHLAVFAACLVPVMGYFSWWWMRVLRDEKAAAYRPAMRMNLVASLGTAVCFLSLWAMNEQ